MKVMKIILNKCVDRLRIFRKLNESGIDSLSWLVDDESKKASSDPCLLCPLNEVCQSPVLTGYRNKYEFAVGRDVWGQPAVGFALGAYRDGTVSVQVRETSLTNCF